MIKTVWKNRAWRGCVTAALYIGLKLPLTRLFFAKELDVIVSEEFTWNWRNLGFVSNKHLFKSMILIVYYIQHPWKTASKANKFSKTAIVIRVNLLQIAHSCLLMFSLCYLDLFLMFWPFFYVSLNLVAALTVWILINFAFFRIQWNILLILHNVASYRRSRYWEAVAQLKSGVKCSIRIDAIYWSILPKKPVIFVCNREGKVINIEELGLLEKVMVMLHETIRNDDF